jgi:lauroyl/myristoyl acyltransferase
MTGRERVDAALARGRGAVLWVGHFAYASLLAKVAWHEAGLAVSHLSHPRHGFSGSRFGMAVLNRLVRRVEDRYLGERVTMAPASPVAALRTLERRLRDNRVVSISARDTARRPLRVAFLDGEIALAGGAIDLAHRTGAALLPAFAVKDGDGFVVVVEGPILVDRSLARGAAVGEAARAYAALLERHVLRHPDQWLGWAHLS